MPQKDLIWKKNQIKKVILPENTRRHFKVHRGPSSFTNTCCYIFKVPDVLHNYKYDKKFNKAFQYKKNHWTPVCY